MGDESAGGDMSLIWMWVNWTVNLPKSMNNGVKIVKYRQN